MDGDELKEVIMYKKKTMKYIICNSKIQITDEMKKIIGNHRNSTWGNTNQPLLELCKEV